jgi:hypothetical protein
MDEPDDALGGQSLQSRLPAAFREARLGPSGDRLCARDGLNNYHVYLARVDLEPHGDGQYTFTVTHSMSPVGEFTVSVKGGRGMDEMAVEAHDALIDIFRQLTFRADKMRQVHARHAAGADEPDDMRV